jgi:S-adenosylmethionine:tRNA-ribosyltransferase-isomerase (queuine synthetase)
LNNTKVFPRLYGNKEKQEQESKFFLLRELNAEQLWDVLVDPARKIRMEINCISEMMIQ